MVTIMAIIQIILLIILIIIVSTIFLWFMQNQMGHTKTDTATDATSTTSGSGFSILITIVGVIFFTYVIIYLVYWLVVFFQNTTSIYYKLTNGKQMTTIDYTALTSNGTNSPNDFTYSIWFFIDDWNYHYGKPKVLFGRMGQTSSNNLGDIPYVEGIAPCPAVIFDSTQNNIIVYVSCFPSAVSNTNTPPTSTPASTPSTTTTPDTEVSQGCYPIINPETSSSCSPIYSQYVVSSTTVKNIEIQKWNHLLITVFGKTLDIYINGKIAKSTALPGITNVNSFSNAYVTPNGGFSGWTDKFLYLPRSVDSQEAWSIYSS